MIRFDLNPKGSGLSLVSMLGFECVGTSCTLNKVTINVVAKVINVDDTSPESSMRENAGGLRHKPGLLRDEVVAGRSIARVIFGCSPDPVG